MWLAGPGVVEKRRRASKAARVKTKKKRLIDSATRKQATNRLDRDMRKLRPEVLKASRHFPAEPNISSRHKARTAAAGDMNGRPGPADIGFPCPAPQRLRLSRRWRRIGKAAFQVQPHILDDKSVHGLVVMAMPQTSA